MSKRRDRPYQAGRSKHWVKVKNRRHPAMDRVMEAFAQFFSQEAGTHCKSGPHLQVSEYLSEWDESVNWRGEILWQIKRTRLKQFKQ